MPLDIDGAGRSKTLACLPTARGTVAPTRGQVPGGDLLGTSTGPYKVIALNLVVEALAVAGWLFPVPGPASSRPPSQRLPGLHAGAFHPEAFSSLVRNLHAFPAASQRPPHQAFAGFAGACQKDPRSLASAAYQHSGRKEHQKVLQTSLKSPRTSSAQK